MLKESTLLFLTCVIGFIFGITVPCDQTYQAENGKFCYHCSEGYYKVSDCVVNWEQARCRPCGNGEYQPDCDNSTKCELCASCLDHRHVIIKDCTATSNTECQCKAGFYWKPYTLMPDEGNCFKHSECKAGEGLVEKGTPYENTKCAPCEEGVTYSSKASFDACVPCSECNSTVASKCTTTNDSVCSSPTEKPSPTEGSSKDGNKDMVIGMIVAVLAAVVFGALVIGCCLYRRRKTKRKKSNNGIRLTSIGIHNGRTHNYTQSQTGESHSSQISNGVHQTARDNGVHQMACDNGVHQTTRNNGVHQTTRENGVHQTAHTNGVHQTAGDNGVHQSARDSDVHQTACDNGVHQMALKNGVHQRARNRENRFQDSEDASTGLCNNVVCTTSSQNNGTSTESSEKDCQNDCSIEKLETLKRNTGEVEKIVEDMNQKYYDIGTPMSELDDGSANSCSVNGETISVDAACVPPRHGVQRVSFTTCISSGADMSDQHNADLATRTNACSEIDEADIGSQPERKNVLTTAQRSPPNSRLTGEDWHEENSLISSNMTWVEFKMLYRGLASKTNAELYGTAETDMANAYSEEHSNTPEAIYRLMIRWRQATPDAGVKHVLQALIDCRHKRLAEKLQALVDKKTVSGQISHNGGHVVQAPPPRGELSGFHSASQSH